MLKCLLVLVLRVYVKVASCQIDGCNDIFKEVVANVP